MTCSMSCLLNFFSPFQKFSLDKTNPSVTSKDMSAFGAKVWPFSQLETTDFYQYVSMGYALLDYYV